MHTHTQMQMPLEKEYTCSSRCTPSTLSSASRVQSRPRSHSHSPNQRHPERSARQAPPPQGSSSAHQACSLSAEPEPQTHLGAPHTPAHRPSLPPPGTQWPQGSAPIPKTSGSLPLCGLNGKPPLVWKRAGSQFSQASGRQAPALCAAAGHPGWGPNRTLILLWL
ncbi:hypothetical protein K461DRAFT_110512 [Myriangium duriaei CBS 260.36]|uniref:Uncharacterized protein n=1 Tax=Myriangium duriaei CBS 260.36 TaxID=1168546 RepID=A0A9P4MMI9_9PEZI|nr:hypothetical protein K461DRAFT_110512 [Myriangium duriaei CBS 260.36]